MELGNLRDRDLGTAPDTTVEHQRKEFPGKRPPRVKTARGEVYEDWSDAFAATRNPPRVEHSRLMLLSTGFLGSISSRYSWTPPDRY
jgi:hypothetical protein